MLCGANLSSTIFMFIVKAITLSNRVGSFFLSLIPPFLRKKRESFVCAFSIPRYLWRHRLICNDE